MNKYTFRAETLDLLRDISRHMAALAENQGLTPIYHDWAEIGLDPHDYGGTENPRTPNGGTPNGGPTANALDANEPRTPRVAADVPQEATIPAASDAHRVDPGTSEGEAAKPPQNAVWPTEPGLYWIRGESEGVVREGVARLISTPFHREFELVLLEEPDAIWEGHAGDRLTECVPLTCVPTEMFDELCYSAAESYGRASDTIHDIEQWAIDHQEVTE